MTATSGRTGLSPTAHDAIYVREERALAPGARTMAEGFRAAGYQAGGFAAHGDWLHPAFGTGGGLGSFTT